MPERTRPTDMKDTTQRKPNVAPAVTAATTPAIPAAAPTIKKKSNPTAAPQRGFLDQHLCVLVVGFLACSVLVLDQVWHLFDLPRSAGTAAWSKEPATLWIWVYAIGLLLTSIAGLCLLLRSTRETVGAMKLSRRSIWLCVSLGSALIAGTIWFFSDAWRLPMGSAILLSLAWAAWLLLQHRLHPRVARGLRVVLIAVTLSNILGEAVWWLAFNRPVLVSFRPYTMWAIVHLLFIVCAAARIVDVWQCQSRFPVRGAVLALLLAAPLALRATTVLDVTDHVDSATPSLEVTLDPISHEDRWYQALLDRLDAAPADQDCPYILIAASGGGSRAALFAALVYEHLSHASVGGNDPHQHIALISSVSGGSLASAHYVQNGGVGPALEQPTGFSRSEIEDWIDKELQLFHSPESALYSEYHRAFEKADLERYLAQAFVAPTEGSTEPAAYALSDSSAWLLRQSFVNDMCMDFMAPLVRGALHPGIERGEACDLFWRTRLGLKRTIDEEGTGDRPLLLCNVTEVAKGSRLVIGFPSLPAGFYRGQQRRYRGLLDLGAPLSASQLPLSSAVRLSANFPWGFELGVVRVLRGEGDAELVAAIDGGLCDNTGIDTLRYTLEAIVAKSEEVQDANHPASQIVERLRKRGVIVLEIDSGAKPQPPGAFERLFSASMGPVVALQNAAYASSQFASSEHIAAMETLLESDATAKAERYARRLKMHSASTANPTKVRPLSCVQHVKVQCNHEENVMTAWALGPCDKAKIFVKFAIDSQALSDSIEQSIRQQRHVNEWLSLEGSLAGRNNAQNDELLQALLDSYDSLVDESLESGRLTELQARVRQAVSGDEYYRRIVDQLVVPKHNEKSIGQENARDELDSLMAGRIQRSHRAAQAAGEQLRFLRAKREQPAGPEASRTFKTRR